MGRAEVEDLTLADLLKDFGNPDTSLIADAWCFIT